MNTSIYIYSGYMIFCWYHLYIIKHMLYISLLNDTFIFIFCEKPNVIQYSFVNIHFFCIIIIDTTVVQIITFERKYKCKITVKNTHTNNCNTIVYPLKRIFWSNQCWIWKYVKQGIISIFFLQYFICNFYRGFPLYLINSIPHLEQI